MKSFPLFTILALMVTLVLSCNNAPSNQTTTTATTSPADEPVLTGQSGVVDELSEKNILHVALGSKDHSTLVAAVKAAELADVLTNAGPLTVFAPTNEAFDKLPEGTVDNLLKPENKATLAHIIKYHAAPGKYDSGNIRGVMGIGQATGDKVKVETKDGVTTVNGAKVLASVEASNGVVHVIDQVLLPPEQ